ncbi:pentapeptide repeat-containing protein [Saccharopolyspora sp. 5N708]|uniref:pentapeptide repeat-containing protein n=1 Tax=Saccharopolyspora sp. 5N708 TaxID=3457424 RepID=UPI003FD5D114
MIVLLIGSLAVLSALILFMPGAVVDHDLSGARIAPKDRLSAVNAVRTTLLQAAGGIVVFFGAYATWRQLRISQDGLNAMREGHVTDRFTNAVDQLGSDKLDVRIGGLYALWRVADHSPREREAVISIMAAFLRTHLPWPPTEQGVPSPNVSINEVPPLETRAPDSQVALTALGVLSEGRAPTWLNVSGTDLRRADCDGLNLQGIVFDRACMEAATLYQVNLTKASLAEVNLRHAELATSIMHGTRCVAADLRGVRLVWSDLFEADLTGADLREANLRKARARGTLFTGADLRMADLRGTDLSAATLTQAQLQGALVSKTTTWPIGFDVSDTGVIVTDDPNHEPTMLSGFTLRTDLVPLRTDA